MMTKLDALGVQPFWTIITVGVAIVIIACYWSGRRTEQMLQTQVATTLLVGYAAVILLLVSTSSHYFFRDMDLAPENSSDAKRMMLAASAGLIAQFLIWLNRLTHAADTGSPWYAMYADAIIGAFCGLAGLTLVASTRSLEVHAVTQTQAASFGFAGGAVDLGLVTLARKLLPFSDVGAAGGAADARGACMYAGQAYSDGATISMPSNGLPVVKVCDGKTGCWKVEQDELASLGLR